MSLRLAVSVTLAQTVCGLVFSFLSIKVTSVYLGPAGIGTLGQLGYFMAMTQAILGAGIGTGLVKKTAELKGDTIARDRVISTVLRTMLALGLAGGILVFVGANWIAHVVLNDMRIEVPLVAFAAVLTFGLMTNVVVSCANGAQDFRAIATVNIATGLASLVAMTTLTTSLGLAGALFAAAVLPLITFSIALLLTRGKSWWPRRPLSMSFSAADLRSVASFVPVAIINSVGPPVLQLGIRDQVIEASGMFSVGMLQGVMRISDMYVGIVGGVLAMYFFPKFCEAQLPTVFSRLVLRSIIFVAPLGVALGAGVYYFREVLVTLIFTDQFVPMIELFGWQTIGSILKIVGWPLAFALLAKANPIVYAIFEILTLMGWWLFAYYLIRQNGTIGATQAYALTYFLYALVAALGVWRIKVRIAKSSQT